MILQDKPDKYQYWTAKRPGYNYNCKLHLYTFRLQQFLFILPSPGLDSNNIKFDVKEFPL